MASGNVADLKRQKSTMLWLAQHAEYDDALAAAAAGARSPDGHIRSTAQLCFLYIVETHGRIDLDLVLPLISCGLNDAFHYASVNAEEALSAFERCLPDFSREDHGIAPPPFGSDRDRLGYLSKSGRHCAESLSMAVRLIKSIDPSDRRAALLALWSLAERHQTLSSSAAAVLDEGLADPDKNVRQTALSSLYYVVKAIPTFTGTDGRPYALQEYGVDD